MVKVEKHGKIYFTRTETYYIKPFKKILNLLRVEFRKPNAKYDEPNRLEGFNRFIKTNEKAKYQFGRTSKYDFNRFANMNLNRNSLYNVLK